jgi:thiol-disulfide isomerase/thioredoxin
MKIKLIVLMAFCFVVMACTPDGKQTNKNAVTASVEPKACAPDANAEVNKESPSLKLTTFDGACYDLAQHRGKWVVVNFWATWCGPCKTEIPEFNTLDKKREDVEFIGLAYEEIERADMDAFLKVIPINYPIAVLDVFKPPADFDTPAGLPLTYVIAPDGKVADKFLGPVTSAELEKVFAGKK